MSTFITLIYKDYQLHIKDINEKETLVEVNDVYMIVKNFVMSDFLIYLMSVNFWREATAAGARSFSQIYQQSEL